MIYSHTMKNKKPPLLKIDKDRHEIFVYGDRKHLPLKQYQILVFLYEKKKIFSRSELIDAIWPGDKNVDVRTVDQHCCRLRANLGFNVIESVAGVGYRIAAL